MRKYRIAICVDCKEEKRHHAHGRCRKCYLATRVERTREMNNRLYHMKKNTVVVVDSLLGQGTVLGKPFIVDGEELVLVKFRERTIEWKTEELRRIA